jgi:hypothetical protein
MFTPGALDAIEAAHQSATHYLTRHQRGDWGTVCPEDAALNDEAAARGGRILSAYTTPLGTRLWVITEADRQVTTILLPSEY